MLGKSLLKVAPRRTFALQLVCLAGLWALFGLDAFSARNQARDDAVRSLSNIAAAVAIDIAHDAELLDRALQAAGDSWQNDEIRALKPSLRHIVLFENAVSAEIFGPLVILDPYGSVLARSDERQPDPFGRKGTTPNEPEQANESFVDREAFKVHIGSDDAGLFVGSGILDGADRQRSLPLSRRLATPEGDFAGVVMGTIRLSAIQEAYDRLALPRGGLLALVSDDGSFLARRPAIPAPGTSSRLSVGRIGSGPSEGMFQAISKVDGIERIYAFHRVGGLPLSQFAGLPVAEVYADWRRRTLTAGSLLLVLSAGILALQLLLARELRSRIEAEAKLEELALQDAVTGICNRRVFDRALEREWRSAMLRGSAVGLLMIDVDHFKAYNDHYGHVAGDDALRRIAAEVDAVARGWGGIGCRVGGEEFAILLPAVIGTGGRVAEELLCCVAEADLPHVAAPSGIVTVSIGLSVAVPADEPASLLVERADRQLYLAKQAGRNRCSAELDTSRTLAA